MFGLLGLILFIVAAILHLVGKHNDWLLWLIIGGGLAYGIELAWGWNTRRRAA